MHLAAPNVKQECAILYLKFEDYSDYKATSP